MTDEAVRDEIAFIRRALEEGRGYASGRSPDMMVWGVAVAVAYAGTYARVRGWWGLDPDWLWAACIGLPWIYSLRAVLQRAHANLSSRPMARAMAMLWLAGGIALTLLAGAATWTGGINQGWLAAVAAGIMGIGFFVSAVLCNLAWMRAVALGWWLGEVLLYVLRYSPEALLLSAALMLALLALPGFVLLRGGTPSGVDRTSA